MPAKALLTTKLSTKGQVILPKEIRNRRGWSAGTALIVEDTERGVLLKPQSIFPPQRPEDVFGCAKYTGPALSLDDMDKAITAEIKHRHARRRY